MTAKTRKALGITVTATTAQSVTGFKPFEPDKTYVIGESIPADLAKCLVNFLRAEYCDCEIEENGKVIKSTPKKTKSEVDSNG